MFIHVFFWSFPLIFAEIRYKLSNFVPKLEIVDKLYTRLIINEKE